MNKTVLDAFRGLGGGFVASGMLTQDRLDTMLATLENGTPDKAQRSLDLLTIKETARLLKCNERSVRRWIKAGSLPAVSIGMTVRINKADLLPK